jgi:hypothetical protein
MTQVRLTKGTSEQTTFIPHEFAKKDKLLKIKENDVWEEGWKVSQVYGSVSEHVLKTQEKVQRKYKENLAKH